MKLSSVALASLLTLLAACKREPERLATQRDEITGDRNRGHALLEKFECARCHGGLPVAEVKNEKACVGCHEKIVGGTFTAAPEAIEKWQPLVRDLRFAPTLDHAERFRQSWLESYLEKPHDLRPSLRMTMPRLAMTKDEARDLASFLRTRNPTPESKQALEGPGLPRGNAEIGKKLLGTKGCTFCHRFTGAADLPQGQFTTPLPADKLERSLALAPDLKHARDRMAPAMMAAWIHKPSAIKPSADMPDIAMTDEEARDLATYIVTTPLTAPATKPFERLAVLTRPVRFDEVNTKVFHRTCWHCHSEPDFAIGDGGPGNSGGFGFAPKGIDLSSFQGVMAGFFDRTENKDVPKRKSLFVLTKENTPRLLAALVARHAEENGAATGEVRGMPLGLPGLPAEDIQLVESWIAQGRPR